MLSDILKAARQNRNMTQEELAESMHVSRSLISKWETGKSVPDDRSCEDLSAILGVPLEDLLAELDLGDAGRKRSRWFLAAAAAVIVIMVCAAALFMRDRPFGLNPAASWDGIYLKEYVEGAGTYSMEVEKPDGLKKAARLILGSKRTGIGLPRATEGDGLFSIQVRDGKYPYTYLDAYRMQYGYYLVNWDTGEVWQTDVELMKLMDEVAFTSDPEHVRYSEAPAKRVIWNLEPSAEIPVQIICEDDMEFGSLKIRYCSIVDAAEQEEQVYMLFADAAEEGQKRFSKGYNYQSMPVNGSTCTWVNHRQIQGISLMFYAYDSTCIGTVRIPVYELNDTMITCRLYNKEGSPCLERIPAK